MSRRPPPSGGWPPYDVIVLISLDTLRSDVIAANPVKQWPARYHAPAPRTAVLDELVAHGTFFASCIAAAPYTAASHASFLTGLWPVRHGLNALFNRRVRRPTLFAYAHALGFRTVLKTDFPAILGPSLGFTDGVDDYIEEDDERALAAIASGGRAFALIHFAGAHTPYGFHDVRQGGHAYVQRVAELEAEIPAPARARDLATAAESDLGLSLRYRRVIEHHYGEGHFDRLFSLYTEGVTRFLEYRFQPFLERLLDRLRGTRFLLVLFGDHGEEYDAGSYGHQNSVSEGVLRVPLVFYGPDVPVGLHLDRVRAVDLAPTLLGLLGGRRVVTRTLDGASLAGTIWHGEAYPLRPAYAQVYSPATTDYRGFIRDFAANGRAEGHRYLLEKEVVYDGRYRLIREHYERPPLGTAQAVALVPPRVALAHLDARHEWVAADERPVAGHLGQKLDEYTALSRARPARTTDIPDAVRNQLYALGYTV